MIGQFIDDKYRVLDQISADHLATGYLARDQAQNQMVVLKLIRPEMDTGGEFLERFRREAEKSRQLTSPQAVKILDYGQYEGAPYVVSEYVGEKTLADLCQAEGALPVEQVLGVAQQVGLCLVNAHAHDLVHRDLHPANILLAGDNQVKVTNFGTAWGLDLGRLIAEGKLERDAYHAPELAAGTKVDSRADLYSLGAVLFEMLTGVQPPMADDTSDAERRPSHLRPDLPPEADDLVARCLATNPKGRPQSAAEFLEGIDETLRGIAMATHGATLGIQDALAGHTLGAYRVIERLGRGGMATVYKAYEPSLDRYVAIKVLPQHLANDPEFLTRFRREAKAIARLNHPNIVPVFNFGQEGNLTYIAMRYVEGGTLKNLMGQPMTLEQGARLVVQIARALSYAHQQGVVHRDVKPANVLMAEGDWPLLSDFGLARMTGSSIQLTQTGVGVGTPAYMSPEQGQGLKVDGRSDIYSLGIMLYEMLTGQVPFQADTPMAVVLKHITAPLPMPRQVNPNIPEPIERMILKATAKDPAQRYQTAEEMIEALDRALAGRPVEAPPAPVQETVAAETVAPVVPPPTVALPSAAAPPTTARRLLKGLLRTVGALLVVLVIVVAALLLLGSFAASSVIEKAVAGATWGDTYPGSRVTFDESEIERSVAEAIRLYLPGSVENVSLNFVPPDRIEVQGEVFGKETSLECTLTSTEGMIDFQLRRMGDTRLYLVGNILSGGVNRGLKTLLEERSLRVEKLTVDANSVTIQYAGEGPAITPVEEGSLCEPGEIELLSEDFEDGEAQGWRFHDGAGRPTASWSVEADGDNHLLVGTGHNWAVSGSDSWTDYRLQVRMRRVGGASDTHINVRIGEGRYYLGTVAGSLYRDPINQSLAVWRYESDTAWHEVALSAVGGHVEVYLDSDLVAEYDDPNPLPPGAIGLENLAGTTWYDDVLVCGRPRETEISLRPTSQPEPVSVPTDPWGQVVIPPGGTVKLALVGALSGSIASLGEIQKNAFLMAIEDLATVKDFPIEAAIIADGGCGEEGMGGRAAETVISNPNIVGVIGHTCSRSCGVGAPLYEEAHLVMISQSCTNPELSSQGYQVFNRVMFRDDQGGDDLNLQAANTSAFQDFARRYQSRYGQSLLEEGQDSFAAFAYDATGILIQAIKRVAVVDEAGNLVIGRQALAEAVRATPGYPGITGVVTFEDNGDRQLP